jgi:hypothetical protein
MTEVHKRFTRQLAVSYDFSTSCMDIQHLVGGNFMAKKQAALAAQQEMSGMERLALRVSSMINHPVAQAQRWVTIHRLDTDGDREWEEVLSVIADTDELELTLNDDGSVTVRWEQQEVDVAGRVEAELEREEEAAPF